MRIEVNISKRYFIILASLLIVLIGAVLVYTFNSNNPPVMGHNLAELQCGDSNCDADGDGKIDNVSWAGITGMPEGFSDNVDNGTCILYTNVHSQTCPAGKYVMRYIPKTIGSYESTCVSLTGADVSYYVTSLGLTTQYADYTMISDKIAFGYLSSSGTRYNCRVSASNYQGYKGDVLCC